MMPKNPFLAALFCLFIISSIIHVSLVIIYSLFQFSYQNFNFFNIVGLNLFFLNISVGWFSQLISLLIIFIIYFSSLFFIFKKRKKFNGKY